MTLLVENDDASSSFIDHFAENLPSPGLAEQAQPPPYAASPTRLLFNHGGVTWSWNHPVTGALSESEMGEEGETTMTSVVNHPHPQPQRDDNRCVNTECNLLMMSPSPPRPSPRMNFCDDGSVFHMPNLLVNMEGGMMMSPPRMNFSGEEALFLMPDFQANIGVGMMMNPPSPRMNFPLPSGDSIDPVILWNYAEEQELENGKGMMMRPTWNQPPCIEEVDGVLGQNQSFGIWAAALEEAESMGGMVQQSCWAWGGHPQRSSSDDHSFNNVDDEWFQLPVEAAAGGMTASSPMMNYSLPWDDDSLGGGGGGGSFDSADLLCDDLEYNVFHELQIMKELVKLELLSNAVDPKVFVHEELCLNSAVQLVKFQKTGILLSVAYKELTGLWKGRYCAIIMIDIGAVSRGWKMEQTSVTLHPQTSRQFCVHSPALQSSHLFRFVLEEEFEDTLHILQLLVEGCHKRIKPWNFPSLSRLYYSLQGYVEQYVEQYVEDQKLEHWQAAIKPISDTFRRLNTIYLLSSCKSGLPGVTPCLLSLECLCQNMVVELGNGEEIMRLNVNKGYLEVDFSWEKKYAVCSSRALELESWGGMMMERISVSHQWRYAFSSKSHCWSVIPQLLDVVVRLLLLHLEEGTNNYSFCISVNDDPSVVVNTTKKMHTLFYFERTFLEMHQKQHLHSLERLFLDHFESSIVQTGVAVLLSGEEIKLRYLEEEKNHTFSILPALGAELLQVNSPCATNEERNNNVVVGLKRIDAIGNNSSKKTDIIWWQKDHGITRKLLQQLFGKSHHDALKVSPSTFKPARRHFGITRQRYLEVGTATKENHSADIWPALEAAECSRGGMLLLQQDSSSCEAQIPESSATNERNVVELKNIDTKGNSSSKKTDSISRWEKDHGISRQVLEQLFGKSRDDAAKTLKVSSSTLKRACRDFGITRWPNHKGKRANSSLNQKQDVVQAAVKRHKGIQPCPAALPPVQATNTSQCNNSTMSVKITYENDTIRFPLSSSSTMKYLAEQLETKLKISVENLCIKYQDEEDEWITLTCDSELMHGMDVLRSCGKTVIRMMLS